LILGVVEGEGEEEDCDSKREEDGGKVSVVLFGAVKIYTKGVSLDYREIWRGNEKAHIGDGCRLTSTKTS